MNSNLLKNIDRITWRFKEKKPFTANKVDIEAFNGILKWIQIEKEERINENRYFGKIIIYCLMREIEYLGDIHFAEKKIHDILERPLEYWYDRVRLMFVLKEYEQATSLLNIDDVAGLWDKNKDSNGYVDVEKMRADAAANKILMQENIELLVKSLTSWQQSEINDKLNHFITELLNEHGNKS